MSLFKFKKIFYLSVFLAGFLAVSAPASSQELGIPEDAAPATIQEKPAPEPADKVVDILPAKSAPESVNLDTGHSTHPPIKMTPDKSELLHLDQAAGTVIIGNPLHLNVLADSAKTLVLVPRQPGATYMMILDTRGDVIMQRHVLVAAPKERYVRIRRSCAGAGTEGCQQTQVYYCPDMCHEILMGTEAESSTEAAAAGGAAELVESTTGEAISDAESDTVAP